nr:unnamed protein product [Callosobruchus chinensis]
MSERGLRDSRGPVLGCPPAGPYQSHLVLQQIGCQAEAGPILPGTAGRTRCQGALPFLAQGLLQVSPVLQNE